MKDLTTIMREVSGEIPVTEDPDADAFERQIQNKNRETMIRSMLNKEFHTDGPEATRMGTPYIKPPAAPLADKLETEWKQSVDDRLDKLDRERWGAELNWGIGVDYRLKALEDRVNKLEEKPKGWLESAHPELADEAKKALHESGIERAAKAAYASRHGTADHWEKCHIRKEWTEIARIAIEAYLEPKP